MTNKKLNKRRWKLIQKEFDDRSRRESGLRSIMTKAEHEELWELDTLWYKRIKTLPIRL